MTDWLKVIINAQIYFDLFLTSLIKMYLNTILSNNCVSPTALHFSRQQNSPDLLLIFNNQIQTSNKIKQYITDKFLVYKNKFQVW